MQTLGWLIYSFFYYFAVVMYWVFYAAIEHGGIAAGATLLVIFLFVAMFNRGY